MIVVNYIGFHDKGMLLAGGCGDTNGGPQIEKTDYPCRVFWDEEMSSYVLGRLAVIKNDVPDKVVVDLTSRWVSPSTSCFSFTSMCLTNRRRVGQSKRNIL